MLAPVPEDDPDKQLKQLDEAAIAAYAPAAQEKQLTAPTFCWYIPKEHRIHVEVPELGWYAPLGQDTQLDESTPVEYVPG